MPGVEQFEIDGHVVSTGLLMPTAEDNRLMATMETFPEDWIWDPKDIEKALVINGVQRYTLDRKKRAFRIRNQGGLGKCFPAGTLIRMADGSQKPIEEIRTRDKVLTAEGRIRMVLKTMVRSHSDDLVRVCAWGNRHLTCTAEHPILTRRGYVPAEELTSEDWVSVPKFAPQTVEIIETVKYVKQPVGVKNERKLVQAAGRLVKGIPGKRQSFEHRVVPPDFIELDYDFGWFIGMFLAEGALNYSKVQFCLAKHEEHTLAARLCSILQSKFGIEATLVVRNNECQVKLYGCSWGKLLAGLVSEGCGGKNLSAEVASGPKVFLEGVLDGWQAGDGLGCGVDSKHHRATGGGVTVSHALAMNMYDIANCLGKNPKIESLEVKINPKHKIKTRRTRWLVQWPLNPIGERKPRFEAAEKTVWRKMHKLERVPFSGWVYNFEVEDDHSYVAEGLAVHNCNASSNASGFEQIREIQGMQHVPLADCYTYIGCNGGKDQGSGLPTTFTFAQTNGFSPYRLQCGGVTKTFPNDAYNQRQVPADVFAQAKIESARFMGVRLLKIPVGNFQLFCQVVATAIARRLPIIWAWQVGGPGSRLNNGYMQVSRGMGNHSNLLHSGKWVGGKNLVDPDNENSWGPTADPLYGPPGPAWGENGFGLCTMEDSYACAHIHPPYIMISASADVADGTYKN